MYMFHLICVCAAIFAVVACLHAVRLVKKMPLVINEYPIPMWASVVGLIASAIMVWWCLKELTWFFVDMSFM